VVAAVAIDNTLGGFTIAKSYFYRVEWDRPLYLGWHFIIATTIDPHPFYAGAGFSFAVNVSLVSGL